MNLEKSWQSILADEMQKDYFVKLDKFLQEEYKSKSIYPVYENIFAALNHCPVQNIKVVILGQDPYHGKGQAQGLSFSVPNNIPAPPSLKNIFKELENSCGIKCKNNDLTPWAKQGVLLLNTCLTVEDAKPTSHANIGWQEFTKRVIKEVNDRTTGTIFVLWGNYAKGFANMIDKNKHLILESAHPSPFSAYNGFFGNNHFKRINQILKVYGKQPINWEN